MLWSVCSPKAGLGVSVVAAVLALELAHVNDVVLIDTQGDLPPLLGVEEDSAGLRDWIQSDAPASALAELVREVAPGLHVLAAGNAGTHRADRLHQALSELKAKHTLVADLGLASADPFSLESMMWAQSDRSVVVVRACYLALRRATRLDLRPTDLVEVMEGGRALSTIDIETVFNQPVVARLPVDPAIARCVDAGLLLRRRPRVLRRFARDLASTPLLAASA